jgi:hypothetical protein
MSDVFRALLPADCPLPLVHCYHFAHKTQPSDDLAQLTHAVIEKALGAAPQSVELHVVRYTV